MSRDWQLKDILGIGNLSGDPDPLWGGLSGENAIKDATAAQQAALEKAFNVIQEYTGKAIAQQQPYTQNAGQDFARQRGLVQSGYFRTPYGQSFQPQQYKPSGFSMNPGQGMASFQPQSFGLMGYTPQGLPPMPQMPAYQPPPQQGGLMGGAPGGQLPPLQDPSSGGRGPAERWMGTIADNMPGPNATAKNLLGRNYMDPYSQADRMFNPFTAPLTSLDPAGVIPGDPMGKVSDLIMNTTIDTGSSLGNKALAAIDPRTPLNLVSTGANKAGKKIKKLVRGLF